MSNKLKIPLLTPAGQSFTLDFMINVFHFTRFWLTYITMLEHPQLLISTVQSGPALLIQNPENSTPLGNASYKSSILSQNWTVHEDDDNPVVFTLNKLKVPFANWTINDACDLTVGFLYSNQLLMPTSRIYCYRTIKPSGITVWEDEVGSQLASLQPQNPKANLLVFNENQRCLPFGRMLILADYLIQYGAKLQL